MDLEKKKLDLKKPLNIWYSDNGEFKPLKEKLKFSVVVNQMRMNIKPNKFVVPILGHQETLMSSFGPGKNDAYAILFHDDDFIGQIWDINFMAFRTEPMDVSHLKTIINGNLPPDTI